MDLLEKAILRLSKEEARAFKLFARKVHTPKERKDLELFDIVRKNGEKYNDELAYTQLYAGQSRNNLARLKSRLLKEINKSQLLLNLEGDDTLKVYHMLSLSHLYLRESDFELAFHYLRKAERLAGKLGALKLLDLVYDAIILLSKEIILINPKPYLKKRQENLEKLNKLRKIDDLLAGINYKVRKSQMMGAKKEKVLSVLKSAMEEFGGEDMGNDPLLRTRLFNLVSQLFLQQQDFAALESFTLQTYQSFVDEGLFTKTTHQTKLQILSFAVNTLFKNGKYPQSLEYAKMMRFALEEYGGFLKERYWVFYFNSLVINYSILQPEKAIETLNQMANDEIILKSQYNLVFIHLNLLGLYYSAENYKSAIREVVKISLLDTWKATPKEVKLQIGIYELMVRYRLGDYESVDLRLPQIQKDFSELLEQPTFQPESRMLQLIERLKDFIRIPFTEEMAEYLKELITQDWGDKSGQVIEYRTFIETLL